MMNFEGDKDPSVRRRSMDGHLDRTMDNGSVASAISVEEYEETVRSETHIELAATPYVQEDQQIDDNSVLGPICARDDRRAPGVHQSYICRTPADNCRTPADTCRTPADNCRTLADNGRSLTDTFRTLPDTGHTTPYTCRTPTGTGRTMPDTGRTSQGLGRTISDNHTEIIGSNVSTFPAIQDVAQRNELLVAQQGSIAGKAQSSPTIVKSGLSQQYGVTQHQPGEDQLSSASIESEIATTQIPIVPRSDRWSNIRSFNDRIGCTVDSPTVNPVDFRFNQVGLSCQSSQSVLNCASLSATTSYVTSLVQRLSLIVMTSGIAMQRIGRVLLCLKKATLFRNLAEPLSEVFPFSMDPHGCHFVRHTYGPARSETICQLGQRPLLSVICRSW